MVSVGELKRKTIEDSLGTVVKSGSRVPMSEMVRSRTEQRLGESRDRTKYSESSVTSDSTFLIKGSPLHH